MKEAKRIRSLKKRLIKELPFFPNNKDTLADLESQSLNEVLIHYLHWKTRLVPARTRKIQIAPEVTSDKRWKTLKNDINSLLNKIRNAENVLPYLSKRAHSYGYTPSQRIKDGEVDSWEDKDQLLNTKGFHHFHLDMNVQNTGLSERTDDVLFAYVSRDTFHAIGIFNHSVFESVDENGNMNAERSRMWDLHEKHVTLGMGPGTAYTSHPIATSGHPVYLVRMADYYARTIRENDPKLDDREFVNGLYDQGKLDHPSKYNFDWHINALDLCVYDKKTEVPFNIYFGHI
jgi:hypothetical protein